MNARSELSRRDFLHLTVTLALHRQAKNGFYDAELNALFIHSAGDSQDNGIIWVYRYKRVP